MYNPNPMPPIEMLFFAPAITVGAAYFWHQGDRPFAVFATAVAIVFWCLIGWMLYRALKG